MPDTPIDPQTTEHTELMEARESLRLALDEARALGMGPASLYGRGPEAPELTEDEVIRAGELPGEIQALEAQLPALEAAHKANSGPPPVAWR